MLICVLLKSESIFILMKLKSNVNTADIFFTIIGPSTKEHHSIQYLMSKDLVFSNYFEYFIKYFFCPLKNWCFFKPVDFWKLRICVSVSNGTGQCNFSGQRDKVPSLSRDKGTKGQRDKLKILPRESQNPGRDAGQSWKGRSKTEKGCSETENVCSKTENVVLKQ